MNQHGKESRTKHEEDEDELNIYTIKKLLSFPTKVNNNNNSKKSKTLECNCWVCKILDSSSAAVTKETVTSTKRYEAYNIASETGDSIYFPQYEELTKLLNDDGYNGGQVFVSEIAIEEIVNCIIDQKRLGSSLNNIENDN